MVEFAKNNQTLELQRNYQKGHSHKIKNLEEFKLFVARNNKMTARQMVIEFEKEIGIKMAANVMGRYLKKIGYSVKKTFGYIEADKAKRALFLEELSKIDPSMIVYSDETGIDD